MAWRRSRGPRSPGIDRHLGARLGQDSRRRRRQNRTQNRWTTWSQVTRGGGRATADPDQRGNAIDRWAPRKAAQRGIGEPDRSRRSRRSRPGARRRASSSGTDVAAGPGEKARSAVTRRGISPGSRNCRLTRASGRLLDTHLMVSRSLPTRQLARGATAGERPSATSPRVGARVRRGVARPARVRLPVRAVGGRQRLDRRPRRARTREWLAGALKSQPAGRVEGLPRRRASAGLARPTWPASSSTERGEAARPMSSRPCAAAGPGPVFAQPVLRPCRSTRAEVRRALAWAVPGAVRRDGSPGIEHGKGKRERQLGHGAPRGSAGQLDGRARGPRVLGGGVRRGNRGPGRRRSCSSDYDLPGGGSGDARARSASTVRADDERDSGRVGPDRRAGDLWRRRTSPGRSTTCSAAAPAGAPGRPYPVAD